MSSKNIFEGESTRACLSHIIYQQLMAGKTISYYSVLAEYRGVQMFDCPKISEDKFYSEAKKAFMNVLGALNARNDNCVKKSRDTKHRCATYRYVGKEADPLKDILNAATIRDLRTYFDFCQKSAGLMPLSWLESFFKNTKDLQDMRKRRSKHEQIIIPDYKELRHIELLPVIFNYIDKKAPFRVIYRTFENHMHDWIVHPHYLREYNGRWYVLGYVEDRDPQDIYTIPLDRIEEGPYAVEGITYRPADLELYKQKFDPIIGVTLLKDTPISNVRVRVYTENIWGLFMTKPLHQSQVVIQNYDAKKGYGDIELTVAVNKELEGRLLHYGDQVEVLAPDELRTTFRSKVITLCERYNIPLSK